MMELVDMQGLKPCPIQGPGSSPGVGIKLVMVLTVLMIQIYTIYIYNEKYLYILPAVFDQYFKLSLMSLLNYWVIHFIYVYTILFIFMYLYLHK